MGFRGGESLKLMFLTGLKGKLFASRAGSLRGKTLFTSVTRNALLQDLVTAKIKVVCAQTHVYFKEEVKQ